MKQFYESTESDEIHCPGWPLPTDQEAEAAVQWEKDVSETKERSV